MHRVTMKIFDIRLDKWISERMQFAKQEVEKINSSNLTNLEIRDKAIELSKEFFTLRPLHFVEINKFDEAENVSIQKSRELIPQELKLSSSSIDITVSGITYEFKFTGDKLGFNLTSNLSQREIPGETTGDVLKLKFFFQGDDFNNNGPKIKSERDEYLNSLLNNNKAVITELHNRMGEFIEAIRALIEERLLQNKQTTDRRSTY